MNHDEASRWNERYASGDYVPRPQPSTLVEQAIEHIGAGKALVLACGTGRNALRLADAGFEVEAVDVSSVAIALARAEATKRGLEIDWKVADVRDLSLTPERYDLITMIRYVNRDMWPYVVQALSPDGWLVMEQHLRTHREVTGPGADYRIEPGELLGAFPELRIIHYTESIERSDRSGSLVASARLLACRGDPGW